MRSRLAQMRRRHHRFQGGLNRAPGVGQEGGDASESLVRFGVEHMKYGTDQQRMAGLLPVVPAFERAFWIDEDVGDILDVANFPLALPHFQQGLAGSGGPTG